MRATTRGDSMMWFSWFSRLLALRLVHAIFATLDGIRAAFAMLKAAHNALTWRTVQKAAIGTVPAHVGIVIRGEDSRDVKLISTVVHACADAGIECITLCDTSGDLVNSVSVLRTELCTTGLPDAQVLLAGEAPTALSPSSSTSQASVSASGTRAKALPSESAPSSNRRVWVRTLTLTAGKQDLVQAARQLCERVANGSMAPEAVDEASVHTELSANAGFPEPVCKLSLHAFSHHGRVVGPCASACACMRLSTGLDMSMAVRMRIDIGHCHCAVQCRARRPLCAGADSAVLPGASPRRPSPVALPHHAVRACRGLVLRDTRAHTRGACRICSGAAAARTIGVPHPC